MIDNDDYKKEVLVDYDITPCFGENRHTLNGGSFTMSYGPAVWIVLDGTVTITGDDYVREVKKGEYFFLPYCCENKFTVNGYGTLIECLPSKQD